MPNLKKVRLGVVGAGKWGQVIIRALQALPSMQLASVVTQCPEKLSSILAYSCHITSNWQELLDNKSIDGLIVATPTSNHIEITRAAVSAKIPVLVEKPLTFSCSEAKALLKLVKKEQGYVLVDHIHLFNPAYQELKKRVLTLGPIHSIETWAGNYGPFRADTPVLWDWGVHDVAICLDLLGTLPTHVAGEVSESHKIEGSIAESLILRASFPNCPKVTMHISNLLEGKLRKMLVRCARGDLCFDDLAEQKLTFFDSTTFKQNAIDIPLQKPLDVVLEEFACSISKKKTSSDDLVFAVAVTEVLERYQKLIYGTEKLSINV